MFVLKRPGYNFYQISLISSFSRKRSKRKISSMKIDLSTERTVDPFDVDDHIPLTNQWKLLSADEKFFKINISFLFFSRKVDKRKFSLDECAQTWTNRGQSYPTHKIDEKYSQLNADVKFFNSIVPLFIFSKWTN